MTGILACRNKRANGTCWLWLFTRVLPPGAAGSLVADAFKEVLGTDFGVTNSGSLDHNGDKAFGYGPSARAHVGVFQPVFYFSASLPC